MNYPSSIELNNISFGFAAEKYILANLSLSIVPGEFVGIIGANGSGKTTLARLLNGNLLPTNGEVLVAGLSTRKELAKIKRCVSVVYADAENQLITPTVYEELLFSLQLLDISAEEINERVNAALDFFDLREYKNHHPYTLSTGEQFRLLIAVAWTRRPQILVLDEVLSALDSINRHAIRQFLKKWRQEQPVTMVMITHRLEDLCEAGRIIVLDYGRLVADGTTRNIFEHALTAGEWNVDVPLIYRLYAQMSSEERELYQPVGAMIPESIRTGS